MLKKSLSAGLASIALAATAHAQTPAAPAAPASPHTFSANLGVFSQYIFRGLTQTDRKPALQGGLDYSHSSGFYIGTWMTNISWLRENFSTPALTTGQYQSGGHMEIDVYGGYKSTFGKSDFTYDVGLLQYIYPGTPKPAIGPTACTYGTLACPRANTLEAYGALGWKWITVKYSHSLKDETFGVPRTRGTNYIDLTADIPVGETGFTVNLHYGKQTYKGQIPTVPFSNNTLLTYSDWKAGVSYNLPKDFVIGAYATGTGGANTLGYGAVPVGPYPHNIAKTTGTVFLKKNFNF
mgnify:CR=1 FL=1